MNIFLHELKFAGKSVLIWSGSMTALSVLYILVFKGLGSDIASFAEFMKRLPEAVIAVFNIYLDSLSRLEGFYSFVFSFVVLCGAVQAMNLGTGILSKEVRDKTADFLMTKPVSRPQILTAKLLAALTAVVMTNILYMGLTFAAAALIVGHFDVKLLFLISLTMLFVQMIFLALGFIVSVAARKIRSVISVSLSAVFGLYILGSLGAVIGEEAARYISPFRYFETSYILANGAYEQSFVLVGFLIIAATVVGSYLIYLKKDIHAV
jgi:ABC-2 type transport system permease protein